MKGQMNLYYDEESDYLEIFVGDSKSSYGEEVSEGITLFKDEQTEEIIGVGILGFKKRSKNLQDIKISLPLDIGLFSRSV